MESVFLESDRLRVGVVPAYGARVTNFFDKHTGREWMAPGGFSPNMGEAAVYAAAEAVGWDECFPTVAPWDANTTVWNRQLRDHGDLWGRSWTVVEASESRLVTSYHDPLFSFERNLVLEGYELEANYRVVNLGKAPMPYLWALHALLAVRPGDKLDLGSVSNVSATYLASAGRLTSAPSVQWPGPSEHWPLRLDEVHSPSAQAAAKLYTSGMSGQTVSVGQGNDWLDIGLDQCIDHLGIWLNYGGWPKPGDVHHIALEPTSGPADHLGQVLDLPNPPSVAPGASNTWRVTMSVRDTANPSNHSRGDRRV